MRFFGMRREEVFALPLKTFWFLSAQIRRLRADEARMALKVGIACQSGKAADEMLGMLNEEAGEGVSRPNYYDREGMRAMAARHGAMVSRGAQE